MVITRREALKLSIATCLASLAYKANAQDMSGKKVIVVGAGLAGLAAAQKLQAHGAKVVVLEAGNYVGGRVRTDWSLGAPFEFGAGWIHGPSPENPIKQLVDQINAQTFVTEDDNLKVFNRDGNVLTNAEYERLEDVYSYLEKALYNPDRPGSKSVKEVLSQTNPEILSDPIGRWMLSAFFEFSIGAGIEDISAANGFESDTFAGADVILTEGYNQIIAFLKGGLDIRLNAPVSKITYDNDGIEVDGEQGDFAICTVPLGVLKSREIAFIPPLPDTLQDAIKQMGLGTVTKIALKFSKPFWDLETQYFGIMTEPKGRWNYWLNYRTFSNENILLGVSVGHYAAKSDRMSKTQITADAIDVLRSVWGKDVGTPEAVLATNWSQEPHFKGAYSYAQAGGAIAQFSALEKAIVDRIFFAGEHTNFDYLGTTHGAFLSGHRAADAILKL